MVTTTDTPTRETSAINPQRLAWFTMLAGLVVFVLLCIGTVAFARWLVFESPTGMNVTLHVGQGTVGLQAPDSSSESAVRSSAEVNLNDRLSTDNLSQGYLAFSDPYSGDIVATVMLGNDSAATLSRANRPRFNLSENAYTIRMKDVVGNVEVWVSNALERHIQVDIETPQGMVRIVEQGNILITVRPDEMTVTARDGSAVVHAPNGETRAVARTMVATLRLGASAIELSQGPLDLLPYSTFGTAWPKEWICAHVPDPEFPNAPGGDTEYGMSDGRPMIHLWRYDSGPTPAKTGCYQQMGDNGSSLDVMPYESLHLRVTMKVIHQSLSACGIAGTECAIMLRMDYIDQNSNPRIWYHGFYAEYRPGEGMRICDSCWEPHEQINPDSWYTYESGDLLNEWPKELRPGAITRIEFYASGHEYDVMLNEVALIATLPDGTSANAR